ncbi:MAG: O-methyltransferase [Candidatus Hydrogenedentes bacterium]|nr:O-methyltransferase [Candidatus Hydrogenedentota bacterium]
MNKIMGTTAIVAMLVAGSDIAAQQTGPAQQGRQQPRSGRRVQGRGMRQRPPARRSEIGQVKSFDTKTLPKDDAEKKILDVLDDMDKNQRRGNMNVPVEDGRLLRTLVEAIDAKQVVEIGTSNGYSGIWMCLALRKTGGKLITHDIDEGRAALARENFKRAGVDNIVTLVMGDAHDTVKRLKGPIDLLFLDADKEGYIDYLDKLLPLVRPGGLILAHNMTVRMADKRYVDAITTNPELETLFLHMDAAGMAVSMKKR